MGVRFKPDDPYFIYGLVDPRTDKVRYVGKTYDLKKRKADHIYEATHPASSLRPESHKNKWVRKVINSGGTIDIKLLEETTYQESDKREQFWVSFYGRKNLTNDTDGGSEHRYFQNDDILDISKLKNNITRIRSILKHKWKRDQKRAIENYIKIMFDLSEYNGDCELALKDKNFIENNYFEPSDITSKKFNLPKEEISIAKYLDLIKTTFSTWDKCSPRECFYDYTDGRFNSPEGNNSRFERVFGEYWDG